MDDMSYRRFWLPLVAVVVAAGGGLACRSGTDPRAVAEVATAAGRQVAGAAASAPQDSSRVWTVEVAAGVRDSARVVGALADLLKPRPRLASDSIAEGIAILSAASSSDRLTLQLDLTTRRRCGPTWGTTVAWSGAYNVGAHRVGPRWVLDSVALSLDGVPTICHDSLGRPFPPIT
jgi:hypothetical protein